MTCPKPNIITRCHIDMTAYLAADATMRHVNVIREGARDALGAMLSDDALAQALAGGKPVNGKAGLALILFTPEGKPETRAARGIRSTLEFVVRAVEDTTVNDHPEHGTGIPCEDLILETMLLLQLWNPLPGHPLKVEEFYKVPLKDQPHLKAWECLVTTADQQDGRSKCNVPQITPAGSVTITTTTPGADIYFTTDGSLPTPGGGQLYSGPIDTEGPMTIRATAWKDGMRASDCAEAKIEA